jgi:gamma-glutamyltranspeptidase/glutathione hydrolase
MSLQQAIDAPTFHTGHVPSSFWPRRAAPGSLSIETRFPERTLRALERRGHLVQRAGDWSLGRLSAVGRRDTADGPVLEGAANPRLMQGYAVGR